MYRLYYPIIALLLWASPIQAGMLIAESGTDTSACAAGCTSVADADVSCEDFTGTGYRCTGWGEWTTNGTVGADAAHSGTFACTDKGTQALNLAVTTASSCDVGIYRSITATSNLYRQIYFNVVSESLADGGRFDVWVGQEGTGSNVAYIIGITQVSGNLRLRAYYYNGSTYSTENGTSTIISTGTWYGLRIKWISGSALQVQVQPTVGGSWTTEINITTGVGTRQIDQIQTQMCYASNVGVIQFDNDKVDVTAYPTQCPGP